MKHCVVPEAIRLKDPISGALGDVLSFRDATYKLLLNDPRWNDTPVQRARLVVVMKEFDKQPGETMVFDDQDFAMLKQIIEKPTKNQAGMAMTFDPLVQIQVDQFLQVILDASDGLPSSISKNAKTKSVSLSAV